MPEVEKAPDAGQEPSVAAAEEGPRVTSVFVSEPEGLPDAIDSPFWAALPRWGGFRTVEGAAEVAPLTEFCISHDAHSIALHIRCDEPEMAALWTRRTSERGRLDLDDCVEVLLDPYHAHGFRWRIRVTPSGQWEALIPVGACAKPECQVEVRAFEKAWEALVRVPFVDVGLEGDLRGTPVNGDLWGLALVRRRREAAAGRAAGRREVAAWSSTLNPELPAEAFGHLVFEGGREKRPVEFTRYAAGGFGVNEICVALEGGGIPEGVEVSLKPAPAAKLRSKDASRYKFRVARPGLYRYSLRLPYAPPPEPTEDEIAEIEAEAGRELSDEELTERLAGRAGTPEYVAGLSFNLPDLWSEVEEMESEVEGLRGRLAEGGTSFGRDKMELLDEFEETLNEVDRYRAPHAKGRLGQELIEKLRTKYADVRGIVRGALLKAGRLSVATTYLPSGSWSLGALRVRTNHSDGTESAETIVPKLRKAGLSFVAFADRPEGGDQDGDGANDWNGDGVIAPAARRIEGSGRAVREDQGREAYVRDYTRTAAEQGRPWVTEDWKLSVDGAFVVLRAVEVGAHYPALCIGVPAGALPSGSSERYDQVTRTQESGGLAVMCEGPGDLRELPVELSQVLGIDAPIDAWERLLGRGRKLYLAAASRLDGADFADGVPEKAALVGVLAASLSEAHIMEALRRGSFYLTTGPRITGVEVKGDTVTVRTEGECQIFFRGETGQVLGGAFGTEASYRFTGRERHVRAVCLADVREDGFRLEATTQPFYLADELPRSPLGTGEGDWTIAEPVDRSNEPEETPAEETSADETAEEAEEPAEEGPEETEADASEAGSDEAEGTSEDQE